MVHNTFINMELIYLFPRELWHTAQPILINGFLWKSFKIFGVGGEEGEVRGV